MTRIVYAWQALGEFDSPESVTEFKYVEFCSSRVIHTDPACQCHVCRIMTEKRLGCVSRTCKVEGKCKCKIWGCTATKRWHIYYNGIEHLRDETTKREGPHRAVITAEMKRFILQQDECSRPPMLILSNLRRASGIIKPTQGFPTLAQVTNCAKYLRILQGTKNSLKAVGEIVQQNPFDPTGDLSKPFCFGHRENASGHPYVGKGTDVDSFVVGVSSRTLVEASIEYASASRYTLFHADATFMLSDLGYPVITCAFSDVSRCYQLAAIFIISRRTAKAYAMCLEAFVRLVKHVQPTATFSINAAMGDVEDAQLNGFQQVHEFGAATYLMGNVYYLLV
ncbi:hypothetical protein L917_00513 [Phytophthora nicotianae]|uniref:MULE transposase domain-containing protein n=1 Tax=Phytophthora nicotianae TaxID=4792 RepID=W2M321_PHYNI|nr:hypothetical protein L917_00513 [Phytophthora nicotianae]